MPVTVEFYGIAKQRAGVDRLELDADSIGEAFDGIASRLPQWGASCLTDGELNPSFLANLNAKTFVSDRNLPLTDGDHLLILATDVGG